MKSGGRHPAGRHAALKSTTVLKSATADLFAAGNLAERGPAEGSSHRLDGGPAESGSHRLDGGPAESGSHRLDGGPAEGDSHRLDGEAAEIRSRRRDSEFLKGHPAAAPAVVRGVTCVPQLPARPAPRVLASPASQALAPPSKQLWYAVVFPDLCEAQRPAPAASVLQRLCLSALQFTSLVSIEEPNALLLEIKGSVKLFGSLSVLHASIDAAWSGLSMRAHSAAAPTTLAALWLARAGKKACIEDPAQLAGGLAELPITCMAWHTEWLQTLRAMGVTRIGELLRLPRSGISRRLSPAAVLDLDIALARQAAPRRAFVPRRRFRERCDLETEVENVAYLQKALEPLVERCARFLRERQAGIQALELKLRHRLLPMTRVRVGLASITGDRRRLAEVLNEKLNRLELAAPVRGMELLSGWLQPLSAGSADAFALRGGGTPAGDLRSAGRDAAPQLVERLRARLGEEAVYGIACIPEHRPEAAWQRIYGICPDLCRAHERPAPKGPAHARQK